MYRARMIVGTKSLLQLLLTVNFNLSYHWTRGKNI